MRKWVLFIFFAASMASYAQEYDLVEVEAAKPPKFSFESVPQQFGIKLNFLVSDSMNVNGLVDSYNIYHWKSNTDEDLLKAHKDLALEAVRENYRIARDTSIIERNSFWKENGKGFSIKFHNWVFPKEEATNYSFKGAISYTVLKNEESLIEDITHLVGNFTFDNLSMEFKGNTIDLSKEIYGKEEEAYSTFKGSIKNKDYNYGVQKIEFIDANGETLDVIFFGYNNTYYDARTRNRVDLTNTATLRIYYAELIRKNVEIDVNYSIAF